MEHGVSPYVCSWRSRWVLQCLIVVFLLSDTSLFLHYSPVDWDAQAVTSKAHFRIPPDLWYKAIPNDEEELVMVEASFVSFIEPGCEHDYCGMKDTKKWSGPAEAYGKVLTTGNVMTELDIGYTEEELVDLGNVVEEHDEF